MPFCNEEENLYVATLKEVEGTVFENVPITVEQRLLSVNLIKGTKTWLEKNTDAFWENIIAKHFLKTESFNLWVQLTKPLGTILDSQIDTTNSKNLLKQKKDIFKTKMPIFESIVKRRVDAIMFPRLLDIDVLVILIVVNNLVKQLSSDQLKVLLSDSDERESFVDLLDKNNCFVFKDNDFFENNAYFVRELLYYNSSFEDFVKNLNTKQMYTGQYLDALCNKNRFFPSLLAGKKVVFREAVRCCISLLCDTLLLFK
jgi:hypothetical protein